MSKCDLRVVFDRANRAYVGREEVSGTVSRAAGWVDQLIVPLWPVLADRLAMCLRKPAEGMG